MGRWSDKSNDELLHIGREAASREIAAKDRGDQQGAGHWGRESESAIKEYVDRELPKHKR